MRRDIFAPIPKNGFGSEPTVSVKKPKHICKKKRIPQKENFMNVS